MNHNFVLGQSYNRDSLLDFVSSRQTQSGIIWGPLHHDVVICTSGGKHGAKAGYKNGPNKDGTWTYFGQGENGDQDPESPANRLLIEGKRSVVLFSTREPTAKEIKMQGNRKKLYAFTGDFCIGGWEKYVPSEGRRKGDLLIKFTFVPIHEGFSPQNLDIRDIDSINEAKVREAFKHALQFPQKGKFLLKDYFLRSELLRKYAKERAKGNCEFCQEPAPFLTETGEPFLEVHHIFRLADDGPDAPENVAALCPNCHKAAHYGQKTSDMRSVLAARIVEKEGAFSNALSSGGMRSGDS